MSVRRMRKILIIDDSVSLRESLRMILKESYSVAALSSGKEASLLVETEKMDLVILGVSGPLREKTGFLQNLVEKDKDIAVLFIVEHQTQNVIPEFFRHHISDFILSPFSVYEVREKTRALLARRDAVSSFSEVAQETGHASRYQRIYNSPLVEQRVANMLAKTLNNDLPVLIEGEYGSGHELIARIIHYNGLRRKGDFFQLNCADLIEESFMNFFRKVGEYDSGKRFGTVFLEEVERADSHVQMRLMETLEEQAVASKNREMNFNLRIIVSSHVDLSEKVYNREFRGDLFYRLKAVPIILSPLRQRRESIPLMADYFLEDLSKRMKLQRKKLSSSASESLKNYYWPGNVCELESVVTRSAILTDQEIISDREISFGFEDVTVTAPRGEDSIIYDSRVYCEEREGSIEEEPLDVLAANLAHEVKNPLVAIKTFTQLLSERFEDAEFRGQFYNIVGENVEKIDGFIKNIMDYTAFLNPSFQRIDLNSFIEKSLEKNGCSSADKTLIIVRDFENDLPPVWSDKDQLQYVFEGVLSEALHGVHEKLTLYAMVSTSPPGKMNHLPGLEHADERIVEVTVPLLHSRIVASSPKEAPPIVGLELYLAQRLVNKNLGAMEIRTTDDGKGVVEIRLPVARMDEQ